MRYMIYPYCQGSRGAKAIAEELGGKRILRQGSSYTPLPDDVIINWGASDCPFPQALNYGTHPVTNKNRFFKWLDGTGLTPPSCITKAAAAGMTFPVFCRTKVEGRDGAGIVIANSAEELVDAPLYVEGVKKTAEYRVHVGRYSTGGAVLGAQKKWVPNPAELSDPNVWTGDGTRLIWEPNGQPLILPPEVRDVVLKSFDFFPELDFGAFDVVWNANTQRAYVLEINSAPMITPKTAKIYGDFFRQAAAQDAQSFLTTTPAPTVPAPAPEPLVQTLTVSVPAASITVVQNILLTIPGVSIDG